MIYRLGTAVQHAGGLQEPGACHPASAGHLAESNMKGDRKEFRFSQVLVTSHLLIIVSLIVLGSILFTSVFSRLTMLQMQTRQYSTIRVLAESIASQRDLLRTMVLENKEENRASVVAELERKEQEARESLRELRMNGGDDEQQFFLLRGIENGLDFVKNRRDKILEHLPLIDTEFSYFYAADITYQYLYEYVYSRYLAREVTLDAQEVATMQEDISRLRITALIVTLVLTVLYTLLIMIIVRKLSEPIDAMVRTAHEITRGNLDTPDLILSGAQELRYLEDSLNSMKASLAERITALEENRRLEKKVHAQELQQMNVKRELDRAKLLTLQAQINPHFLFNAMNTISRTALFEDAEETQELVSDLSLLFRYILDQRSAVPLSEELQFITRYLKIQKARFADRLSYSLHLDDQRDVLIPPLLIQPLVENAIIHGLEPKEEGGHVRLTVQHLTRKVVFTVSDDGIGYEESLTSGASREHPHVGIANIRKRIELYYGGKGNITIGGRKGGGTEVVLKIPYRKEDRIDG